MSIIYIHITANEAIKTPIADFRPATYNLGVTIEGEHDTNIKTFHDIIITDLVV